MFNLYTAPGAVTIAPTTLLAIIVCVLVVFTMMIVVLSRYRKCPSDKVMVIYG